MQTFLPFRDFSKSASVLDRQRLGNQRLEAMTLLRAITEGNGWSNHPAARMWRGHAGALALYGISICLHWRDRGYKDTMLERFGSFAVIDPAMPSWLGSRKFHASHRSNLLRKDPEWYGQFGWSEPPDLEYVWPEPHSDKG